MLKKSIEIDLKLVGINLLWLRFQFYLDRFEIDPNQSEFFFVINALFKSLN